MQVVLVDIQPFRRNLLLKCTLQSKLRKKINQNHFWGVQGRLRSSMLTNLKSPSPVLVMICSTSVPISDICNRFHATRDNSSKITTFRGVAVLTPTCAGLLKPRGSGLGLLKSTLNAENFVHRLSWSISSHFVAIQC